MAARTAGKSSSRRKGDFSEFIDRLLQRFEESTQQYIQINSISTETGVEKRRLYDLMNVLVACGVCTKTDTHTYRWDGMASFQGALKAILRDVELRGIAQPIDNLFLLPESPTIGTLATFFISVFLYIGAKKLNIRDAALIMSPDEERSKPVLRRLYLVAYLLEHIGVLQHAQRIGEYELEADVDTVSTSVISGLAREGEFPPDTIEYRMKRLDASFIRRVHEQRLNDFERVTRTRTVSGDDGQSPSLACGESVRGIDI